MEGIFIEDKIFEKEDFAKAALQKGDYDYCTYNNCNFLETDIAEIRFNECTFNSCNLSLANITQTSFRDVKFSLCKMLGLRFETCNKNGTSFVFDTCMLNESSFYQLKIKQTVFNNCQLHNADFIEADIASSVFKDCDLKGAVFQHANLEKADLRGSFNFSINPEINKLKKAKFSLRAVAGLLEKYHIEIED